MNINVINENPKFIRAKIKKSLEFNFKKKGQDHDFQAF